MDYFEEISDVGEMDITSNIIQMPRGRPQTSQELKIEKKAERNRKYRLKQMAKRNAEQMRKTEKPL
jgi:hypothetical protein